MNDRELKRLSKIELLEMMLELSEENEKLKKELEEKDKELESKRIMIEEAGDIAEASLKLNRVFEAARDAADQYIKNIQLLERAKKQEVRKVMELRKKLDGTEQENE